ncbi:MAG: hypothetical protein MSS60_06345 [Clostridiales bacterium]|nr:hypothetical protein [Clostridiales bacterium]
MFDQLDFRFVFGNFDLLFSQNFGLSESVNLGFIGNPGISKHWLDEILQPFRGFAPMTPFSGWAGVAAQSPDGSKAFFVYITPSMLG